jgi:cation diffusion facilitator CzcD-associated flavoprotein CzcO
MTHLRTTPTETLNTVPAGTERMSEVHAEFDAVVVGAGFAGLYALHSLRDKLGLSVCVIEMAAGVGGTWYWNRYPGARCDIESYNYAYSFSDELQQDWEWRERFATQPEILSYLNHVADRFDLRRDIVFETRVVAATFDDETDRWTVETDDGRRTRAQFLISGVGNLSAAKDPEFAGFHEFAGPVYSTARWPHEGVDFTGQRVAVIGTGASGIQVIPEIAKQAAQLTVFQRTPNYATPIGNGPMDPEFQRLVKANYDEIRARSRNQRAGIPYDKVQPSALAVDDEQRQRIYQQRWKEGGFRLAIDSFADLLSDRAANDTVAEFIRSKIRERVHDPAVAEVLTPTDHPYAAKRPPLETNYYEAYNRYNVAVVDIRREPIETMFSGGIRTSASEYELDAIVLATGFDAITGPLIRMGITGRGGVRLAERWADGPHTYLGLMAHGFPNLFTVTGPQSPAVLYNTPLAIEDHVDFLTDIIAFVRERSLGRVEPSEAAERWWVAHTREVADQTLLPQANSWYMGSNVPGKPRVCMVYLGGAPAYRSICADVIENGYRGFLFDDTPVTVAAAVGHATQLPADRILGDTKASAPRCGGDW